MSEVLGINPRWGDQADAVLSVIQAVSAIESGLAETVALVYGNDQRSAKIQYGGPHAMGGDAFLSYVQDFGLGHYEGRGWRGFHHHATLSIAAYGFLMAQRLKAGGDAGGK